MLWIAWERILGRKIAVLSFLRRLRDRCFLMVGIRNAFNQWIVLSRLEKYNKHVFETATGVG